MTGVALFDFLIALVVLAGAFGLFVYAIEGISPDAQFTKIARLAVGVAALVAFLFAVKGVLFGGSGLAVSPVGIIYFAIGIIVVLVVLYLVKLALEFFAVPRTDVIMYVVGACALIVLLTLAANVLFGVGPLLGGTVPAPRPIIR